MTNPFDERCMHKDARSALAVLQYASSAHGRTCTLCSTLRSEVIGNLQISITPLGLFGGWLTATPPMGIIQPSSQTAIQLMYDVSQNEFQGKYQAQVLLTTTARPVAKVGRPNVCWEICTGVVVKYQHSLGGEPDRDHAVYWKPCSKAAHEAIEMRFPCHACLPRAWPNPSDVSLVQQ